MEFQSQNRSLERELHALSDQAVLESTKSYVQKERENTLCVLHHLREVERRRLYTQLGYKSLWEYCTKELCYSESAAQRRISSMRLLRDLPEIETKINSGEMSLTSCAKAASFFKHEAKAENEISIEKKREIVNCIAGKSSAETDRKLLSWSSQPASVGRERIRHVSESLSEIRFCANQNLLNDLEQLKGLLAHKHPSLSIAELIAILAQIALEKLDPARQPIRQPRSRGKASAKSSAVASEKSSAESRAVGDATSGAKSIAASSAAQTRQVAQNYDADPPSLAKVEPASSRQNPNLKTKQEPNVKREPRFATPRQKKIVFRRDQGRCTWRNPKTGEHCDSRYMLQVDHVHPYALGGPSNVNNFRLLCAEHNRLRSAQSFAQISRAKDRAGQDDQRPR